MKKTTTVKKTNPKTTTKTTAKKPAEKPEDLSEIVPDELKGFASNLMHPEPKPHEGPDFKVEFVNSTDSREIETPKGEFKGVDIRTIGGIIVHLRVFKPMYTAGGKARNQISRGEDNEILNDNQLVKIRYGHKEWDNYLSGLNASGWFKADVVGVFVPKGLDYEEVTEVPQFASITEEVKAAFKTAEVAMTPEQKKIKELEEKIEKLLDQ